MMELEVTRSMLMPESHSGTLEETIYCYQSGQKELRNLPTASKVPLFDCGLCPRQHPPYEPC
jgi:hypothetical protein